MRRAFISLLALIVLPSCSSNATMPNPAHLASAVADGSWGGENAQLVTSENDVVFRLGCGEFHSMRQLVPNADGSFVLNLSPTTNEKNVALVARGTVHGSTIDFDVTIPIAPGVHAQPYSVTLGAGPVFTLVCAQG